MRNILKVLSIAICIFIFSCDIVIAQGGQSTIYSVGPGGPPTYDYDSIQDGIDACDDGDQVIVYADTYVECIDFNGKDIIVKNVRGHSVTIDGNQSGPVVTFDGQESRDARLEGFTITNGRGIYYNSHYSGAGIYIKYASPTIKNCTITENGNGSTKCEYGGGIYLRVSNAYINNCTISENYADDDGGGIYIYNGGNALFDGCTIQDNEAGSKGGGIGTQSGSEFKDCNILENIAPDGAGMYLFPWDDDDYPIYIHECDIYNNGDENTDSGGGIYLRGGLTYGLSYFTIDSNEIYGNEADDGGGVYLYSVSDTYSPSDFINNFIYENYATYGGAFYNNSEFNLNVYNNTCVQNEADYGAGCYTATLKYITFTNCIFWYTELAAMMYKEGTGEIYANYCDIYMDSGTYTPGTGNINVDPEFTSPTSDIYTITEDSDCRDAGTNSGAPDHDFEGDPRPSGLGYDMGADEYVEE